MTRAVILAERGFQDEEFVYAYYRCTEEGWDVDVATPLGKDVAGKFGVPARATVSLEWLQTDEAVRKFDLVIIPGGFESPDRLRMRGDVQAFVRAMDKAGKIVAAICHGPSVLISAGILKGRHVTGYESIKDDLLNAGAEYVQAPVVVDGNLVTAPHYRNNGAFMRAVVVLVQARHDGGHTSS